MPDGRILCTICNTTYTRWSTYKIHYGTVHMPAEYYKCRLCGLIIKHKVYFRKHISVKHFKGGNNLIKNYAIKVSSYQS